jgi:hypothetical protein
VECPSGRRSTPRKRVRGQLLRGFKSHLHRQTAGLTCGFTLSPRSKTPVGHESGHGMFVILERRPLGGVQPRSSLSRLDRMKGLLLAALVALIVGCSPSGSSAVHGTHLVSPSSKATASHAAPPAVSAQHQTPAMVLRDLGRHRHARFVAGPERAGAGLFGAIETIRHDSYVGKKGPGVNIDIVRWSHGSWTSDGVLHASREDRFWNFPDNYLSAVRIDSVPSNAPQFVGSEGGGGGSGFMAVLRIAGRWRWARFSGCPASGQCPPVLSMSVQTADAHVVAGRVVSLVPSCDPYCAGSRIFFLNRWVWSPSDLSFVLTSRRTLSRRDVASDCSRHASSPKRWC